MKRALAMIAALCILILGDCAPGALAHVVAPDLSEMFAAHGAIMMLIDPENGDILWANQAAATFYGYTEAQLGAMNIGEINTQPADKIAAEMREAVVEKRNFFLFQHRLASGEVRDVEVYSYPAAYAGETALFSIIHDATEKVQLELWRRRLTLLILIAGAVTIASLALLLLFSARSRARLKKAKRELETLDQMRTAFVNAAGSLVYLKDHQFKYVFVNQAVADFYGKSEDEIVGQDDFALTGEEFARMRRGTDQLTLERRGVVNEEIAWDGRVYHATKFPVPLPDGRMGVGAFIRDISRERAEEKRRVLMYQRHRILADVLSRGFQSTREQLDYALNEALELTNSRYGYIYLYDDEKMEFTLNSWSRGVMGDCEIIDPKTKYKLEKTGFWAEVVRQKKPVLVNDFEKDNPLKKGYPEGHVKLTRFLSVPVLSDGRIVAVVGLANKPEDYDELDVYELTMLMGGVWNSVVRREVEERMRFERARYLKTLVSIGDGVLVVDQDGLVDIMNPVAERLTGWTSAEARGRPYREVLVIRHEQPAGHVDDVIAGALGTGEVQELANSAVLVSRQGARYNLEDSAAPIHGEDGRVEGVVLVFRDVTHKKEQLRQIEYLSFHDALTGLYNRRFFNEELRRLDTGRNLPLSIVMGDVNGLKLTNDIFGHAAGDMLLERIAQVLRRVCRADDIIARWGGDEFVLLLPRTSPEDAAGIVARVKAEFGREHIKAVKGSISMGISCKDSAGMDIAQALSMAEDAMYNNKTLEQDEARNSTIGEIIKSLHTGSPREREHSENVSALSQSIGRALSLPPEELRKLKDAGYLHDIGKITLDRELLSVGRNAQERQWSEIRRHPIIGYRILTAFDDTIDLASAVLAHQERWDGTGYPKNLKGEEIPLAARIIAVAEAYDRLTHEDGGMTEAQAIDYIRKNAGGRFDPRVAEAFANMREWEMT